MILLLALRNIVRNKKNSVIIMLLIGVITALFFIGNSVFARSNKGLRESYTENLTGDLIIEKRGDVTMNLFGANTPVIDDFFSIPVITGYNAIVDALGAFPEIQSWTSQVSAFSSLDVSGYRSAAMLCGIDAASYFSLFPGITLLAGRFLESGEYGAMMSAQKVGEIENETGVKMEPGMPLLFTSAGDAGFKIREVPLVGIYTYSNEERLMNEIIIVDAQTARVLSAIQVATADVVVEEDKQSLLGDTFDIDDLFGMDFSEMDFSENGAPDDATALIDTLEIVINEDSENDAGPANDFVRGGDWNFIIVKLKSGVNDIFFINQLNKTLLNFDAMAVNWRMAAGQSAILLLLLQALFNAGLVLVSIAGIIAIVNILLIAVFRRTREIGTLRAIGASDSYIRALILCENSVIGFLSGITGVVFGFAALRVVNNLRLQIHNELIAGLLGGQILRVDFSPSTAFLSVFIAFALSILASLYPIETAVKIEPIIAVRQG